MKIVFENPKEFKIIMVKVFDYCVSDYYEIVNEWTNYI